MKWVTVDASVFLIVFVVSAGNCHATNQYFMPGDAFFHTELTEDQLNRMELTDNPVFTYDRPDFLPRMFCGYAGFKHLQYNRMPASMKQNLHLVYDEIRESAPRQIEITKEFTIKQTDEGDIEIPTGRLLQREINGLTVFFYNRSFDMAKFRLALKYNEHWADDFSKFGLPRSHATLETFVPMPQAIAEEWRDAKLVSPLHAKLPPISVKSITTPIEVKSDTVAVVASKAAFKSLYEGSKSGWNGLAVYLVTADGVTRLEAKKGHWCPMALVP